MASTVSCAACAGSGLRPHLPVAGAAGPEGLIPTTDRFGQALSDLWRCPHCGHLQLAEMPTVADLEGAYAQAASADYLEEEAGQRETARRVLARLERHIRPPGALLDLGCWTGFLLAEARSRGWETLGVEPSDFAGAWARERLELEVLHAGLAEAELPAGRFQAIVMADVIEHLPDPAGALDRVAGALAPGGVLCLITPDAGSRLARAMGRRWWSVIPTHVHLFTRPGLERLLARRGFAVIEAAGAPKAFTVRYYLGRLRGYSPALSAAAVALARLLGVAERMWAPDFGDRMLLLARRVTPPPSPR